MGTVAATETGSRSWLEPVFALRDRLLMSRRFQTFAAAFPLTRPIARRRARALFDLCAGFVYSQVLAACVRLNVFEQLAAGPMETERLATQTGLPREAAERLLAAAASLDLVARRGPNEFALGPLGAALLGNPGVAAMVAHHDILYRDLADPIALLRGKASETGLAGFWPYSMSPEPAALSDTEVKRYTALMGASQGLIADEILAAYPVHRHRCLLDVGGGDGTFLLAAARRVPRTELRLFDLPAVASRAAKRLAEAQLSDRSRAVGGDFTRDPLPAGADLVSLVRIIHDHDDAAALKILKAVRRAIAADGTLLLAEPMAETGGAEPVGDAYFGFYLLAMGQGRPRTRAALCYLLEQAGFGHIRLLRTRVPMVVRVMTARPSGPL